MIELFYWPTPNGHKMTIALAELGLPHRLVPIDIGAGRQFHPDYVAISPTSKIPAIRDLDPTGGGEPLSLFESGAILLYLAEKTGELLAADGNDRRQAIQWLFWQVSALGPMIGQHNHFRRYAPETVPYALARYQRETLKLYALLNRQLADRDYLAGHYSIADIACYPWIHDHQAQGIDLAPFPALARWHQRISERPAVKRAYQQSLAFDGTLTGLAGDSWRQLFANDATLSCPLPSPPHHPTNHQE